MVKAIKKGIVIELHILILIIIFCFLIALNKGLANISVFGYESYVVKTSSMDPIIKKYDVVITKKINPTDLSEGDIITFKLNINNNDIIFTHHFVERLEMNNNTFYRTKAHGKTNNDPWLVRESDILGKYQTHISKAGYGILFIKSPIIIIMILLDISLIIQIVKVTKQKAD